jgi:hypothetical protein
MAVSGCMSVSEWVSGERVHVRQRAGERRSESEVRRAAGGLCTNRVLVNVVIGRPTVLPVVSASLSGSTPGGDCRRRSVVVGQRNRLFLLAELRVGWRPQLCCGSFHAREW